MKGGDAAVSMTRLVLMSGCKSQLSSSQALHPRWLILRKLERHSDWCIMSRLAIACVLSSAAAFLGARAPLPVKTPAVVKAPAVAMSSALAEESGVSLSSGGGMFTTSSPEDRRIGTELFVSGVRYRE